MKKTNLEKRLTSLINSESREDDSNTPDFLLSEFMMNCLDAFEFANNKREVWYGIHLDILNNWEELVMQAVGEASMCWSETPKGVFDSNKAKQVGQKLLEDLRKKKEE